MDIKTNDTQTSLNISQEVLCTIANEAVKELNGVCSLANLPSKASLLMAKVSSSTPPPQIKLSYVGDTARIDVGIIVELGCKIRDVAEDVQNAIKDSVQDMTGITVSKVNVFVVGVSSAAKTDAE